MPGTTPTGKKTDESDFEFQMEQMEYETVKDYSIDRGRVFDVPVRNKSIPSGHGTKSVPVCVHGRLAYNPCPTCEYEAPKLLERGR